MLIQQVRDEFVVEYKLECQKREAKEIDFGDKIIASWIAAGQQDIADRLKLLVKWFDVYYEATTEFLTYGLPDDYGSLISTEPQLTVRGIREMQTSVQEDETLTTGEVHSIAIYNDGESYKVVLNDMPTSSGKVRLWYAVNPLYYSPTASKNQEWGTFDGVTFTGSLRIPDKYKDLLILFMLGKCFDDRKLEYENKLLKFVGNLGSTSKDEIRYTPMGGY